MRNDAKVRKNTCGYAKRVDGVNNTTEPRVEAEDLHRG